LIEPQLLACLPRENQMAVMNRIERAAVDADFSHSNRFFIRAAKIDI